MNRYRVRHVCRGTPGHDRRRGWYVVDGESGKRVSGILDDDWKTVTRWKWKRVIERGRKKRKRVEYEETLKVRPGARSQVRAIARKMNREVAA